MDEEFLLQDRLQKIRQIIGQYGEERFYLSFSGGKDSTVLSALLDEALPGNQIPRVFINTGIEYNAIMRFVRRQAENDERIKIISSGENIPRMLESVGYPFKSKEHSKRVREYRANPNGKSILVYLAGYDLHSYRRFSCPNILRYQFTEEYSKNGLKISEKCCDRLKKNPAKKWEKENGRGWCMTGMTREEGGRRIAIQDCVSFHGNGKRNLFHPLLPMTGDWIDWYVTKRNVKICVLYGPPYRFDRTGCKGCPFSPNLQAQLDVMAKYMPSERKQCERIWKPVYDEYRRIGYRLTNQISMEEYLIEMK